MPHFEAGWVCPRCKAPADGLGLLDGEAVPAAGDAVVCVYCAGVNIVTAERLLRAADLIKDFEDASRAEREDLTRVVLAVALARRKRVPV